MKIPKFDNVAALAAAKAEVTAAIEGATVPVLEVVVPRALSEELQMWVESFGVRCGRVVLPSEPDVANAALVISLDKVPAVAPEPENN